MSLPDVLLFSGQGSVPGGAPASEAQGAGVGGLGAGAAGAGAAGVGPVGPGPVGPGAAGGAASESEAGPEAMGPGSALFFAGDRAFDRLLTGPVTGRSATGVGLHAVGPQPMPSMPGALHAPLLGVLPRSGVVPEGAVVARPPLLPAVPAVSSPKRSSASSGKAPAPQARPVLAPLARPARPASGDRSAPVAQIRITGAPQAPASPASPRAALAASTFGAAPWLADLGPSEPAPLGQPAGPAQQGGPPPGVAGRLPPPPSGRAAVAGESSLKVATPSGLADGASSSESGSASAPAAARATSAPVVTASTLSAEPALVEPRVRFQPPPAPVPQRMEVRVKDGEHDLRIAVHKEASGYAVEMRAPREVVPELRALEGQIDQALSEDGDSGLASFDAQAEDSFSEGTPARSDEAAELAELESDPTGPALEGLGAILNRKA